MCVWKQKQQKNTKEDAGSGCFPWQGSMGRTEVVGTGVISSSLAGQDKWQVSIE